MNNSLANLSTDQLRRALTIKEQIDALEAELNRMLGVATPATSTGAGRGRRKRSAATRARMAAAQRARWARVARGTDAKPRRAVRRRKVSAAARARMAAAARARWRKAKAAGRNTLAA